MLLHCNNYAFKKTPSYPPWGKIDYALRLRFFLSFILAFLSFFLSFILAFILAFLSFYLYIFISLYKKENK